VTGRLRICALAALALAALAWAVTSLWWPFQGDHGVYAWIADVTLHGGMPYRDAFDVKGPVAMIPALVAQVLFGRNMWGIRVLDLLAVGVSALALYRAGRRWSSGPAALAAALIWVLAYGSGRFNATAQPDGFGAVLLLLATVPLLRPSTPQTRELLVAGITVGLLVLLKPIYLAFILIPLAAVVPWHAGERWRLGQLGAIASGLLLSIGVVVAWFAAQHSLASMLDAYIGLNTARNGPGLVGGFMEMLLMGVLSYPNWLMAFALALAGAVTLWGAERRTAAVLLAWVFAAILVIHLQRPFLLYRAHVLTAPLVLLALVALSSVWVRGGVSRSLAVAVTVAFAIIEARTPLAEAALWLREIPGPGTRADYYEQFAFGTTTAAGELRIVQQIIRLTRPADHLWVYGQPGFYFLANRRATNRLAMGPELDADAPPDYLRAHLAELHQALTQSPPVLLILPDPGNSPEGCLGCFEPLSRMPRTVQALGPRYRLASRADGFAIFALISRAAADTME
jgi:4-amino-4-deoxy-L-arabinose transferase-like glycosyltransferase